MAIYIIWKRCSRPCIFIIESFDLEKIKLYNNLFKEYYYIKLIENNVIYDKSDYYSDYINASYYFPFFVAVWFGTLPYEELIDNHWPQNYINKLFSFYSLNHSIN